MAAADPDSRWRRRVRAAAFVFLAAIVLAGPSHLRLLAPRAPLHGWAMYRDLADGFIDAQFFRREPGGALAPIDPVRALPRERPGAPTPRRIRGRGQLLTLARALCRSLGPGADLRVIARRATPDGWVPEADGADDLCLRFPAEAP